MSGVFKILSKTKTCLESNAEKIQSDSRHIQVLCIQSGVDLLGLHLNDSVHLTERCEMDQLVDQRLQDLDTVSA